METEEKELIKGLLDGLAPVKKLLVSEWADKYRILTSESSAAPGKWRTSRTPYLKEIMDDMSPNSPITDLNVMKGVQLGFTEGGLNVVGCFIDLSPCPIMYVMPTLDMAKAISESRIDAMVENSESLSRKIRPARERDSSNTKLKKQYPGGILVLAGANSAASLRSRPVKVLVLDEVDGYPVNVDNEGSPISLAVKRTSTFGTQRKIYKLSTPTVTGKSVIEAEFENSDQRYYFVPCPHCGAIQHLKWTQMRWEKGQPETAKYECEHCNELIEERYKTRMLADGKWIPTKPENIKPTKKGYHINSLYSPLGWLSWADIVDDYEKALKDVNLMQVFVNTILGETWKEMGEAPEWEHIFNRRENYKHNVVPNDVVLLTAGVDVQGNRLELEIVGWCQGKRSYSIDYRQIHGNTTDVETWKQLLAIKNETFVREDGQGMQIRLMAVDSGFNTQSVYNFCREFGGTQIIPIKGKDKQPIIAQTPTQVDTMKNGKKVGSVKLWSVGVGIVKSELYGWLRLQKNDDGVAPDGYCHFPEYGPNYFKGLVAEQLQFRVVKGFRVYEWVKHFERNEPLDCRVYARAAAYIVGIDRWRPERWETEKSFFVAPTNVPQQQEQAPRKRRESIWKK